MQKLIVHLFVAPQQQEKESKATKCLQPLQQTFSSQQAQQFVVLRILILIVHSARARASLVCGVVEPNSASYETVLRILSSI